MKSSTWTVFAARSVQSTRVFVCLNRLRCWISVECQPRVAASSLLSDIEAPRIKEDSSLSNSTARLIEKKVQISAISNHGFERGSHGIRFIITQLPGDTLLGAKPTKLFATLSVVPCPNPYTLQKVRMSAARPLCAHGLGF